MPHHTFRKLLILALILFMVFTSSGQTADELFATARNHASQRNYPAAIVVCQQAIQQSPDYTEVAVYLGRLYFWSGNNDSARQVYNHVIHSNPTNEEALAALAELENSTQNYQQGLSITLEALKHHPGSTMLLYQRARALYATGNFDESLSVTKDILEKDASHTQAKKLKASIREAKSKNSVTVGYDYTGFEKQFDKPWQITSLAYSRKTNLGSIIGRLNYGNRYEESGVQVELDLYPKITRGIYAYLSGGYSDNLPVFPKYRGAMSLYVSLPAAFEGEAGIRYLNFDSDLWMYTLAAGKYYKNFWFNMRTYLTPSNQDIAHSYSIQTRYYLKEADNYFSLLVGSGISPDDRAMNAQLGSSYRLLSKRIAAGYRFTFGYAHMFSVDGGYTRVEYLPKSMDNQYSFGLSYQYRF